MMVVARVLMVLAGMWVVEGLPTAAVGEEDPRVAQFARWKQVHGKEYGTSEEHEARFAAWKDNLVVVVAHNEAHARGEKSFRLGMNKLADMSNQEYRSKLLSYRSNTMRTTTPIATYEYDASLAVPDEWDWRPLGVVNKVKDQAQCGSCWAFSATAAMEGAYNKKFNGSIASQCAGNSCNGNPCCSFSEQEVVDCTLDGADNCKVGGEMHDGVMEIVKNHGSKFNTEQQYPYTSGEGTSSGKCKAQDGTAVDTHIAGYVNVTHGDEQALKQAVYTNAVVSIGIDASEMEFQLYSDGVYDNPSCHNKVDQLDHGVAIVGYGLYDGPSPGPGPGPGPGPAPGPEDCVMNNDQKSCEAESGCHWCKDPIGGGFCFSTPCDSQGSLAQPRAQAVTASNSSGTPYWTVRNSWGASWGMDGYVLMARNKDNQCGVATDSIYVTISD